MNSPDETPGHFRNSVETAQQKIHSSSRAYSRLQDMVLYFMDVLPARALETFMELHLHLDDFSPQHTYQQEIEPHVDERIRIAIIQAIVRQGMLESLTDTSDGPPLHEIVKNLLDQQFQHEANPLYILLKARFDMYRFEKYVSLEEEADVSLVTETLPSKEDKDVEATIEKLALMIEADQDLRDELQITADLLFCLLSGQAFQDIINDARNSGENPYAPFAEKRHVHRADFSALGVSERNIPFFAEKALADPRAFMKHYITKMIATAKFGGLEILREILLRRYEKQFALQDLSWKEMPKFVLKECQDLLAQFWESVFGKKTPAKWTKIYEYIPKEPPQGRANPLYDVIKKEVRVCIGNPDEGDVYC